MSRAELLSPSMPRGTGEAALVPRAEEAATSTLLATGEAAQVAPNILSIAHWNRIPGGELYAPLCRVDWATVLRRTFDHRREVMRRMRRTLLRALQRPRAPPVAA